MDTFKELLIIFGFFVGIYWSVYFAIVSAFKYITRHSHFEMIRIPMRQGPKDGEDEK